MVPAAATVFLLVAILVGFWTPVAAHEDVDAQIAELTAGLSAGPTAVLYLARGELYRLDRDWDRAASDYARAGALDPGLAAVPLAEAALDVDRGRFGVARDRMDRFLAKHPGRPAALDLRYRTRLALGDRLGALEDLNAFLGAVAVPVPEAYLKRADLQNAVNPNEFRRVIQGLDEGIARLGPLAVLELRAVDLESAHGDFEPALARLDRLAPQYTRPEALLARRGELLRAAGRPLEAGAAWTEALSLLEARRDPSPADLSLADRLRGFLGASETDAAASPPKGSR